MADNFFVLALLLGTAISEWVEIKVVNKNKKQIDGSKIISSTSPSYEAILIRPQHLYEISVTTPTQENFTDIQETRFSTIPFNMANPTLSSDNEAEITIFKDRKTINTKKIVSANGSIPETREYPEVKETNNDKSFDIDDDDDENDDDDYEDDDVHVKNDLPENNPSQFGYLLKNVQRHLLNYKGKSIKGKITLLKELRDNMLYEIKTRISKLWLPPKTRGPSEPRGYKEYYSDDHYHMDYPSNEGALMTIGFLTFAVFLIKLVLKLIYTLKYKQQYYFQTTTTTAASVFLKRSEREITEDQLEKSSKIMQYIEEYPLS